MTVAIDFADLVEFAPVRRPLALAPALDPVRVPRPCRHPQQTGGDLVTLLAPSAASVAAPLRLTRRGLVVLSGLVVAVALAVVVLAWGSAPPARTTPASTQVVSVQSGDTLWSIASRVAPGRDPRAEVADLQRINHLSSVALIPGQLLRTTD
ncbi:MAG TPA: LysM peptidoglycan-binding domain-containing protein [Jatrophihabitantaceae bacterium]|jgi:hypothetical protein